jgi:hypothetical protein
MEQIIAEELNVKKITKVSELVTRNGWESVNDIVEVFTPKGSKSYEVVEIQYLELDI